MASAAARLPFHYGWVIVAAGTLTIFACLGLGRFALGMLLPGMGEGLGLTYSQMGFISTGNFMGYLVAVMVAGRMAERLGSRGVITSGLVLVAVSMMLMGEVGGFAAALVLYLVTGVGSGLANVPLMGLVSHWFGRHLRGRAAGFMVVGSGFAIVFSGHLVPMVNATGDDGWRLSWLALGGTALVAAVLAGLALREDPKDMGLEPVGRGTPDAAESAAGPVDEPERARKGMVLHLGLIYFLFGFTYSIFVTFIVTTLVQERGFAEDAAGTFWAWIGALSLLSGPVFGALSDRAGRRAGLVTVFLFQISAYVIAAAAMPLPFLYLSIGLFGLSAWAVPSIMAAAVGDTMGPKLAARAFGTITVFFGLGQITGPGLAGMIAEASGGFTGSYLMAALGVGLAIMLTVFLRPVRRI